ncbi:HupE/UreJ family protein [Teredinibacter purpureus]|uniref:HupE/UreJ family protein n=1 Tax=Teredinibacter purpureus TaxID=2731756 RepID=UPI0005F838C9|nr:HupE/UreJ family protein [Teredinibacter purpureus]
MKIITASILLFTTSFSWAHGVSEEAYARMANATAFDYIALGAEHMLTGYDHLLFLLGVVFFLDNVKDIVKFVTAFTLGHSLTLILATAWGIQANYYLIDAVIALTVSYKAFENLGGFQRCLQVRSPNIVVMVFVFGLIHGFGLSTRLQQLPLNNDGIIAKAIAFNVGVEIGQIAVLCLFLLMLAVWRRRQSFIVFSRVANTVLILMGAVLCLMQLHSYQHSAYVDDFPLSDDNHYHAHEDINAAENKEPTLNYPKRVHLPNALLTPSSEASPVSQ